MSEGNELDPKAVDRLNKQECERSARGSGSWSLAEDLLSQASAVLSQTARARLPERLRAEVIAIAAQVESLRVVAELIASGELVFAAEIRQPKPTPAPTPAPAKPKPANVYERELSIALGELEAA